MENYTAKKQQLLCQFETDSEHLALKKAFYDAQRVLDAMILTLEPSKQEILYEYLGVLAELQMREIELALMLK